MTEANPRRTARNDISSSSEILRILLLNHGLMSCLPEFSNNASPELHFLLPLDPKSAEFAELFRSFLSLKDERVNILALPEEDAKLFIEIIDRVCFHRTAFGSCLLIPSLDIKALRAARLEPELRRLAFSVLRKLCGRVGYLPKSHLLPDEPELSGLLRASGGFAELRVGVFKGRGVAVKTLRVSEVDDEARINKVGNQAASSYIDSLTDRTALLQRSCLVEEVVPS